MNKTLLFKEIESLPLDLQKQVADFVAFLKLKYSRRPEAGNLEFTDEELEELDRRWQEYEVEPESVTDAEDFKTWVKSNYGV